MDRPLEPVTSPAEQSDPDAHVVCEAREIPRVVGDGLLTELLGISADTYARRKKRGEFTFLLLRPQSSGRTDYSGVLIARWLNGEDLSAIGGSRFFGKGRAAGVGRPKGRANQLRGVAVLGRVQQHAADDTRRLPAAKGHAS